MNEDDLSDEAKEAWTRMIWATSKNENKEDLIQSAQIGWQECRRRAEAIIEERERKAFRAAITRTWHDISDEYFEELWAAYKEQRELRERLIKRGLDPDGTTEKVIKKVNEFLDHNRWAAFSDEELQELYRFIDNSKIYDTRTEVESEIEAELSRRAKEGKHSDKGTEARDAPSER